MSWSDPLSHLIKLRDGRVLSTLREAGDLLSRFPESILDHGWVAHAAELLIRAAEDGGDTAIELATRQVERALKREGMS